jgi:hypothetical protein
MAYGSLKVDNIIFTNGGVDQTITVSGIVAATSGNLTVTGTISGAVVQGGTLVSGATVTGAAGQFTTLTGGTAGFTTVTGTTVTGTTANFVSGVFTTQISGATVTGTTANFTSGNFTNISGGTHTITSGVFATGSATNPSISFTSDPNTGLFSPGADQVAISTNGTGRLFVDAGGRVGVGTASPSQSLHVTGNAIIGGSPATQFGELTTVGTIAIQRTNPVLHFVTADGSSRFGYLQHTGSTGDFYLLNQENGAIQFGTNNTERMRLDSTGRLGLGTSTPDAPLHVQTTTQFDLLLGRTTTNLFVSNSGGIPANGAYSAAIGLSKINSTRPGAAIAAVQTSTDDDQLGLAFCTHAGTASNDILAEQVRITHEGRVGIGTTTVRSGLHVYGAGQTTATISDSGDRAAFLRVSQSGSAAGTGGGILFASEQGDNANSAGFAAIKGLLTDGSNNSAGTLAFSVRGTSSASTMQEAMRIDGSGRLLVGTSSAATGFGNLQSHTTSAFAGFYGNFADDVNPVVLTLGKSRGNNFTTIVQSGDGVGSLRFYATDGTGLIRAAQIDCQVDGTPGASDMPGRLVFSTTADGASSPTERMRIANDGGTFITGASTSLSLSNTAVAGTTVALVAGRHSATAGTAGSGTLSFAVYTNGNVQNTNNSYGAISDLKLKENIVDASSQWDDLKALQVRNYNFKEGQTHTQIGLVAQEVELVSPGLVSESPDRDTEGNDLGTVTKSVNYSVLYMKAVKALQEAMERIETLEAKVAALEAS